MGKKLPNPSDNPEPGALAPVVFMAHYSDRLTPLLFYHQNDPITEGKGAAFFIGDWTGRGGLLGISKAIHGYRIGVNIDKVCISGIAQCPESQWDQLNPVLRHVLESISISHPDAVQDNTFGNSTYNQNSSSQSSTPDASPTPFPTPLPAGTPDPFATPAPGQAYPINYGTPQPNQSASSVQTVPQNYSFGANNSNTQNQIPAVQPNNQQTQQPVNANSQTQNQNSPPAGQ